MFHLHHVQELLTMIMARWNVKKLALSLCVMDSKCETTTKVSVNSVVKDSMHLTYELWHKLIHVKRAYICEPNQVTRKLQKFVSMIGCVFSFVSILQKYFYIAKVSFILKIIVCYKVYAVLASPNRTIAINKYILTYFTINKINANHSLSSYSFPFFFHVL